jgi:type VI secretion system protein ImpH
MASQSRRSAASVEESLYERPARFGFFQAVRLLRRLRGGRGGIGADDPDQEMLRFRSAVSLGFPTSDIAKLEPAGEDRRTDVMTVAFLGMATADSFGSLPTRYAEEILNQERHKNFALRDFLDLFNHRLVSLFYRAWEKYCLPVQYEVGDARFFERALSSVIGMGTTGLAQRLALQDRALLSRAGLLAMKPVPQSALAGVLESYLGVPVEVEQFLHGWYEIDEKEQARLGAANSRLGEDLFIGSRVSLAQFKFGLRLGPLGWDRYQDFLPTAEGFHALVDLVRLAVTPEMDFEARPILRAEEVPALRLEHTPSRACRLGWSTWLKSEEFRRDADDAVLVPEDKAAPLFGGAHLATSFDSMEGRP